ncbi:MAG: Segregation and condensation complex subunit ScpB [Chloroflexi bacterium]|jgi:chromosome segregation and condensation protein ScpB|nr:Segregation and condensation complex subunit ScpB [Chloroflexota bacterium]
MSTRPTTAGAAVDGHRNEVAAAAPPRSPTLAELPLDAPYPQVAAAIATELRRRRTALHLGVRALARATGVSASLISEIERCKRVPSIATFARLRAGLGLDAPASALIAPQPPAGLLDEDLTRLAACVVLQRGATLAALAEALGISLAAVREGLLGIRDRLAAVGLYAVEDGAQVRIGPLDLAAAAARQVAELQAVPELTAEQLEAIALCAHLGSATRRQIEHLRGGRDAEHLLRRLVARGLLEAQSDARAPGAPNVYRVTATALAATGHASLQSLQASLARGLEDGGDG